MGSCNSMLANIQLYCPEAASSNFQLPWLSLSLCVESEHGEIAGGGAAWNARDAGGTTGTACKDVRKILEACFSPGALILLQTEAVQRLPKVHARQENVSLWRVPRTCHIASVPWISSHLCTRLSSAIVADVIIEQGMELDRRRTSAACEVALHSNATCPLHRYEWHSHALHLSACIPYHSWPRIRVLQTARFIMALHSCCHAEHIMHGKAGNAGAALNSATCAQKSELRAKVEAKLAGGL